MTQLYLDIPVQPSMPPLYAVQQLVPEDYAAADYEALRDALDALRGGLKVLEVLGHSSHRQGTAVAFAMAGERMREAMQRLARETQTLMQESGA